MSLEEQSGMLGVDHQHASSRMFKPGADPGVFGGQRWGRVQRPTWTARSWRWVQFSSARPPCEIIVERFLRHLHEFATFERLYVGIRQFKPFAVLTPRFESFVP